MIKTKRIYEPKYEGDGFRVLVEHLWPRGITRERAAVDLWMKDIAPSPSLRTWFSHDLKKIGWIQTQIHTGTKRKKRILDHIKKLEQEKQTITLLYATKDEHHNSTQILYSILIGPKQER